jgi:hypothetical protein
MSSSMNRPLTEHLVNNVMVLALLAAIDHGVVKPFALHRTKSGRDLTAARWFFIHALANLLVVITAAYPLFVAMTDPQHALDAEKYSDTSFFGCASSWPLTIINSVHVYHMIGGFALSGGDYFHHLLFIPALGFPGQVFRWGPVEPAGAFFISGLPGGIDYFLLGLQKIGALEPMTEKRVNANLNSWVRTPGILFSSFCVYQGLLYGLYYVPTWAIVVHVLLPPYNALYYGKQATANYSVHYMLRLLGQDELIAKRINERTSVTTGTQVLDWKDALTVPQRGS